MEEMQKTIREGDISQESNNRAFLELVSYVRRAGNAYVLEDGTTEGIAGCALLERIRRYKGKIDLGINLDEMRAR